MHLLVDVQALQTPSSRARGIGRYSRDLLAGLAACRPGWCIEAVQNVALPPIAPGLLPDGMARHDFKPPFPLVVDRNEASERYYADWLTARAPDAVLVLSWFEDQAVLPWFEGPRPPLFGILYDLIPVRFEGQYLSERGALARYARSFRQLLQSDCLLAISGATAADLGRLLRPPLPRVVPIGGAPSPAFAPHPPDVLARLRDQLRAKFRLGRDFILYVGGTDPRKNLTGAMAAFAALPPAERAGLDLVLACDLTAERRAALTRAATDLGIAGVLKLTGFVSDEELTALYQLCRVFFFPSLYEGLGLPVLEALRCGAPVVAADRSSIPEFAGSVCWLADPASPEDLARALRAALAEPRDARRAERVEHAGRFRWQDCAELACRTLENAVRPPAPRARPRLAWVSPLPPTPSGIADYSAELLVRLADRYDIELIVDVGRPVVSYDLARQYPVVNSAEVVTRHRARPYDLFLYHVGNHPWHLYLLELLFRYRGLVVLHDFHVGGLVQLGLQKGLWPGTLTDELRREGAADLTEGIGWPELDRRVPFNRRLLAAAEAVVIHSAWAWHRVRPLVDVPVARIPHPMDVPPLTDRARERARLGVPADAFLVCSLGWVGPAKRLESLLRAVAGLSDSLRARTLVGLVGPAVAEEERRLSALAAELGLAAAVRWVGRVPLPDLSAYARAADVCVQLRYPTRGETSGALYRALAAGTACIVSDDGPMAEVPPEAAVRVHMGPDEVAELRAALQHLAGSPDARERLAEIGRRHVITEHSRSAAVERYSAHIDLAIDRRRARDARWAEFAGEAAADCRRLERPDEVMASWARLRVDGQRRQRATSLPVTPSGRRKAC
jgi:glycosyltransferase involved in cell wall biosynthesis